jgi:ABC-type transporter Mla subunit MlaD
VTDTRTIVISIIGTGIAVITVVVGFMAILAGGINDRIDDLNATVNTRINDLNASFGARFDDVNRRIDDVNTRIDGVETDLRELRTLVIEAIKADEPADD